MVCYCFTGFTDFTGFTGFTDFFSIFGLLNRWFIIYFGFISLFGAVAGRFTVVFYPFGMFNYFYLVNLVRSTKSLNYLGCIIFSMLSYLFLTKLIDFARLINYSVNFSYFYFKAIFL